eukprot:1415950-Rhodomonas_salina.3
MRYARTGHRTAQRRNALCQYRTSRSTMAPYAMPVPVFTWQLVHSVSTGHRVAARRLIGQLT